MTPISAGAAGSAMTDEKTRNINDNTSRQQKLNAGLQPFTLVKYFSFSALGVFLIFTLFLSWVISNHARDVMLKQSEDYSLLLAENLNQQVFRRFVLPAVVRYGRIALSNPEQFDYLDRIVTGLVQGLVIDSVTIYDSSENIISYSTLAEKVGLRDKGGIEYDKALDGVANSKIIYSGSVLSLLSDARVSCQLKTYIPFRQVKESGEAGLVVMGVIEIVKDLSRDYKAILRLQSRIMLVSSVVMTLLFLVLRTIVSRGGKIIERRTMERFKLEDQLNKSERLAHLGTMVATVSHEIKSPLGIVRSTAEILKKRIVKVAPGNENLAQIIIDETSRLNTIVTEFLDFARPQQPRLKEIDIHVILDRVVRFIRPMAEQQQISIHNNFKCETLVKQVDEDMLYRAFLNILLNGIQAMQNGGKLSIVTEKLPDGTARIELSDTGSGMTAEKVDQIFQPFFTDKHKGTGLGLAIVQNSITSHKGQIFVNSKIDDGTTFNIILP